jgi:hypothetical protein
MYSRLIVNNGNKIPKIESLLLNTLSIVRVCITNPIHPTFFMSMKLDKNFMIFNIAL